MRRPRLEARATLLLALAACGCGGEGPRAPGNRPNVVLISLDTLRADHLHTYGYGRETSPNIDALAAGGVVFENAVSTTSWTLPAHLSMLTGLAVSAHGVCDERLWQVAGSAGGPPEVPLRGTFLPELLSSAGYETAGFYTWKYLEPRFGLGPGFDTYERLGHSVFSHPEWSRRFQALRDAGKEDELRAWMAESPELFDEQRPTSEEAVDAALGWLEGRGEDRPFFLFLHLFDIHDGYVPPAPFDQRFTDAAYSGPVTGRKVTTPDSPVRPDMDPADLAHLISLYDGEIAWVDSQVGRLLERIKTLGLDENTLIVLTSDHGEEFFEHGGKTHRGQLHRESVHVPFIASYPGVLPAGVRVPNTTGIVDIVPTVCSLAGVEVPRGLTGRDLSGAARGEARLADRDYTTHLVVFPPGESAPHRHTGLWFERNHALMRTVPGAQPSISLFDLVGDPTGAGVGTPVTPGSDAGRALFERLEVAREQLKLSRSKAPPRGGNAKPLSAMDIEELQKMGYTGLDGAAPAATDSTRLCLDGCVWE